MAVTLEQALEELRQLPLLCLTWSYYPEESWLVFEMQEDDIKSIATGPTPIAAIQAAKEKLAE